MRTKPKIKVEPRQTYGEHLVKLFDDYVDLRIAAWTYITAGDIVAATKEVDKIQLTRKALIAGIDETIKDFAGE